MDENNNLKQEMPKLGWNWGAFTYNWIWGVGNRCYLPLICLVPFVGFIWMFVCGACGNKWAWESGFFTSAQEFNKTQSTWNRAGLVSFLVGLGIFILYFIFIALFIGLSVITGMN